MVDGAESAFSEVVSGVPQGTVLGPLLFLLHIGDIDEPLEHSILSSFADDTRMMKAVNTGEDVEHLQSDLNRIYQWTAENNMKLNGEKFQLIKYGKKEPPRSYLSPSGEEIGEFHEVRDLGVILENTAKFDSHIRLIAKKGSRIAGWSLRVFSTRAAKPMLALFKALVLSHLEYFSPLWAPSALDMIRELESVQRSFTKRIEGMHDLDYHTRLQRLNCTPWSVARTDTLLFTYGV